MAANDNTGAPPGTDAPPDAKPGKAPLQPPHVGDSTPLAAEPTNHDDDPTSQAAEPTKQHRDSTSQVAEPTNHDGDSTFPPAELTNQDSTSPPAEPANQDGNSTAQVAEPTNHDGDPTSQPAEPTNQDGGSARWAAVAAGPDARGGRVDRLVLRRNPVRMFCSAGPWAATAYLASYLPLGVVCFGGCLVVLVVSGLLNITWLGLPLLIGAAAVLRGCTAVERKRARLVGAAIPSAYRPVTGTGVFAHLRTRWHDPGTWRDIGYLVGLFPALLLLDIAGLAVWLACLAGITLPIWYWSISDLWGTGPVGFPMALLAAVVAVGLSLLACYLVVAVAWVHRALARMVLGPYVDPLADAKRILAGPGPLPTG